LIEAQNTARLPTIEAARAAERSPGVDATFDIDLSYPSGASGSVVTSMTAERDEMTLRLVADNGEVFAHDYMLQYGVTASRSRPMPEPRSSTWAPAPHTPTN
jgi:hypothetical protein